MLCFFSGGMGGGVVVSNENDHPRDDVGMVVAHESRNSMLVGVLPDGEDAPLRGVLVGVLVGFGG